MLHLIEEDQKWRSENNKEVLKVAFIQHFSRLIPVISEVSLGFFSGLEKKYIKFWRIASTCLFFLIWETYLLIVVNMPLPDCATVLCESNSSKTIRFWHVWQYPWHSPCIPACISIHGSPKWPCPALIWHGLLPIPQWAQVSQGLCSLGRGREDSPYSGSSLPITTVPLFAVTSAFVILLHLVLQEISIFFNCLLEALCINFLSQLI